jgi:hypothetical protein
MDMGLLASPSPCVDPARLEPRGPGLSSLLRALVPWWYRGPARARQNPNMWSRLKAPAPFDTP